MFLRPRPSLLHDLRLAALDALRAKVMIADPDLTIVYANPAVMRLLGEAEAELRQALPRFSLAGLIGSNIDVFHRQPDHQRRMLAVLDKPHAATIQIGPHVFDLLVTPLAREGQRLGFVVEWEDAKHRLLNLDYAAQIEAIGRSNAVISFDPQGTILDANQPFLAVMGYTLEEVRGQPHAMFMPPEEARGPEYAAMWEELRAGKFRTGRIRRMAKGGRVVWIEATYNPILDEKGRVVKVVKFASDVTAQALLAAQLGETVLEVDATVQETRAAAAKTVAATSQATGDIRDAAASGGEMARAMRDVLRGMDRAREGTEAAFAQALAVSDNTDAMARAAQAMGGIVALIRSVASQINLLALNATIEAARAGDAGKGFAVVAGEVKNLAVQAARATEQITTEIDGLQNLSSGVAQAVIGIRDAVGGVREEVAQATTAVQAQTDGAERIRTQLETAAGAVEGLAREMTGISDAVSKVSDSVTRTREASQAMGS
ncbi:methyl-accepting chemotaxis protein [Roseococcus microcysteis]|uniref:methyl-accepting chemotaxis protein n=1 Tax=Roseococcus microcysteis TaxID=2771361 RepID=UPI00168A8643|nr:PAS domain-containing methyl-accepting chemotaxis protein [Roseococcus microcysteis]